MPCTCASFIIYKVCIYTPLYSTYKGTFSITPLRSFLFIIIHFCGIVDFNMTPHLHGQTTLSILVACSVISGAWYLTPTITKAEKRIPATQETKKIDPASQKEAPMTLPPFHSGRYVLVNLQTEMLTLNDGTTTLATIPLISQGKPRSYYETIGGSYINDYKKVSHFSSIGHVYMPYSIHVFGNFFIHGIPYYPDGKEVSSTYSGGCIRLLTKDAKVVYDFVEKGTPIIITRKGEYDFEKTQPSPSTYSNSTMTNFMVATISLETLTQDDEVIGIAGLPTTRREMLPLLLKNNDIRVSHHYAQTIGEQAFISLMNKKLEALGLSNTTFKDVISPVLTTKEDYARFMDYITTYKSYLLLIATTTESSL
jgi:L,D-transpeptidase catalytic domain